MQTLKQAMAGLVLPAEMPKRTAPAGYDPEIERRLNAKPLWDGQPSPDPNCAGCRGSGCFRLDIPRGYSRYGALFACECRHELIARRRAEKLLTASMLQPEDLALTWDGIIKTPAIAEAVAQVRAALDRGYGWVYLWGPPGPGKTLVLKTAVAECVRADKAAVMAMWSGLLDHLRAGYDGKDYDERVELWSTVPVLAVDEFGRAKNSDWVQEARAKIFNPRYESAVYKRTVTLFASNFAPETTEDWFADRLRDGRFAAVEIKGTSMRPLMEQD